jgi:hypothetical protein
LVKGQVYGNYLYHFFSSLISTKLNTTK